MSEDAPRHDDGSAGPAKVPEPSDQPAEATQPLDAEPLEVGRGAAERVDAEPAKAEPADPWPNADPVGLPAPDPDATRLQVDDTAHDGLAPKGPSGTGVLPAVTDGPAPAPPPKWSARAQVRPRGDEGEEVYRQVDEWDEGDRPRSLLVPALIGLVVVLFLALIALGVWLGLRDGQGNEPEPVPSGTTAGPTVTRTTRPPTTAPTTTAPVAVPIPPLRGQSVAAASKALTDLGFKVEKSEEPSLEVQEGLIIGTNPPEGNVVFPGTTITLIVSTGPPAPPPTSAAPSPSASA